MEAWDLDVPFPACDCDELTETPVTSVYSPEDPKPRLLKENENEIIMWQYFEKYEAVDII